MSLQSPHHRQRTIITVNCVIFGQSRESPYSPSSQQNASAQLALPKAETVAHTSRWTRPHGRAAVRKTPFAAPFVSLLTCAGTCEGKRDIVEALYGANTTLAKRELEGELALTPNSEPLPLTQKIGGTVMDDLSSAYSKRMIQATWDAPRVTLSDASGGRSSPNVIYIAIDPSGGGASKFSLVSLSLYQLGTRIGNAIQAMSKRPRISLPDGMANTGRDNQEPVGFLVHGMENESILNRDQAYP